MAIHITHDAMAVKVGDRVVAPPGFNGAWIVSSCTVRRFTRAQAITALTLVEVGESGYSDRRSSTGERRGSHLA